MKVKDKFKTSYKNLGFATKKNLISKKHHIDLFYTVYDLACSTIKRNKIKLNFKLKKTENLKYKKDLNHLDKVLLSVFKFDKSLIGEIYDTVSYCSTFLRLISDSKIDEYTRQLLDLKKNNTLYSITHRMRIDPPYDERRTYGWHQEVFYTLPKSKFLQTWAPLIRDTKIDNGTIEVCLKSHKEGIAKQTWNEKKGIATQIIVDPTIVKKYEQIPFPMKVGDVMFFNPHLFHRSGHNSSNEVRFSLVGMWNDTTHNYFRAPIPKLKFRGLSPEEYFNSVKKNF